MFNTCVVNNRRGFSRFLVDHQALGRSSEAESSAEYSAQPIACLCREVIINVNNERTNETEKDFFLIWLIIQQL